MRGDYEKRLGEETMEETMYDTQASLRVWGRAPAIREQLHKCITLALITKFSHVQTFLPNPTKG